MERLTWWTNNEVDNRNPSLAATFCMFLLLISFQIVIKLIEFFLQLEGCCNRSHNTPLRHNMLTSSWKCIENCADRLKQC